MPSRRSGRRVRIGVVCGVLLLGCVLALSETTAPTATPQVVWSAQPSPMLSDIWTAAFGWAPTDAPLAQQDAVAIAQQVAATTSAAGAWPTSVLVVKETTRIPARTADTPVFVVTLRGGPFLPWHSLPIGEAARIQTTSLQVVLDIASGRVLRVSGVRR